MEKDGFERSKLNNAISIIEDKLRRQKKEISVDPRVLNVYVGRYASSRDDLFTVTRDGNRLFVQRIGGLKFEIYPSSSRDYFSKLFDEQITFKVDAKGRATELIHHEFGSIITRAKRME